MVAEEDRRAVDEAIARRKSAVPHARQASGARLTGDPKNHDPAAGSGSPEKPSPDVSSAKIQELRNLMATDPEAYGRLPEGVRVSHQAYEMHSRGGMVGQGGYDAALGDTPENRRNAETAAEDAANARQKARDTDWEASLRQSLGDLGMPDAVAAAGPVLVSTTPVGTVLDAGQNGLKALEAWQRRDIPELAEHLGSMGLDAIKVKKVEKALEQGGEQAAKAMDKLMPEVAAGTLAKDLAKKGLAGDVARDAFARGLKNGFDPREALVYGVYSAHAKDILDKAVSSYGKAWSAEAATLLSGPQKEALRQLAASEMAKGGAAYLKDVNKEVQDRMVTNVLNDFFGEGSPQEKQGK